MELFISVSATSPLDAGKAEIGIQNWKKIQKWIKQEKVKQDSSDYYTDDENMDDNSAILGQALTILKKSFPKLSKSPEPYRATLDKLVELSK